MSIFVDDVNALYEIYKDRAINIRQVPTNFAWGIREMNIADPDGHRLRIGTATDASSDGTPLCED
ncbi:VOC family protein [Acaryochloris sp. IP29b_bin.148]|uniref:VOC family protein n=1 Tax=Acaryochloris sp. IP29b_bin.148 TaxID=2969218 RepID=UPI0026027BC7|nr:VOC family protein [Acaryochloris sp. IP29b_bin.148]